MNPFKDPVGEPSKLQVVILAVVLLSVVFACCIYDKAYGDDSIGISTNPPGNSYYVVGMNIKDACPQLPINIFQSNGGVSNLANLFTSPDIQFGISAIDTLAWREITDPAKMKKILVVMPLNTNGIQLLVNKRSGIKKLEDLNGKRVNQGPIGSGSNVTSSLIALKSGVKWVKSNYSQKEAVEKLLNGEIDALWNASAMPTSEFTNIGKAGEGVIEMISYQHPSLDRSWYVPMDVPTGIYPWQTKSVQIYSVQNLLITYNYTTPKRVQQVEDLTKCIMTNLSQFQESGHPSWRDVEPTSYTKLKWAMHPAAKRIIDSSK